MTPDRGDRDAALPRTEARLVSLSAAIAGGDASTVAASAEEAMRDGASPEALYETLLQSYLFLGFPRAIEAFFAAGPVLERHGAAPPAAATAHASAPRTDPAAASGPAELETWARRGEALCRRVYGRNYAKLMATMRRLSPDLTSWMILEGYGKTLARQGLDPVAREYCVVAILTTTRMWRQLRSHAIGAIHVGGTRARVKESIALCARVAGPATVAEALRVAGLETEDAGG